MRWRSSILIIYLGTSCAFYTFAQENPVNTTSDVQLRPMDPPRLRINPPTTLPAPVPAEIPDSTPPPSPTINLQPPDTITPRPLAPSLRETLKPVSPGYVIRTGDLIHFRVLDEDDMDLSLRVGKDGTIHIPYINFVSVGGKSISQAIDDITKALRVYYISPIVSIEMTEFADNNFTILGQVNHPGVISMPPQVESIGLMDAIAKADGTNAIADMGNVTVKRFVDGVEQVLHVDGRPIARGVSGAHFEVLPGDTVIVALSNNQFKVLGEVRNPGIFTLLPLTDSIDLGDALAMAGAQSSDLGEVTIKRTVDGKETVISLDKMTLRAYSRNDKGEHVMVLPGDTVEVKVAKTDFYVLGQVRNPGVYQLPPQQDSISILEALAMAGGSTRLGNLGNVLVRRKVNGTDENIKVNVKEMQKGDSEQIFQVFPEDTITVGERFF